MLSWLALVLCSNCYLVCSFLFVYISLLLLLFDLIMKIFLFYMTITIAIFGFIGWLVFAIKHDVRSWLMNPRFNHLDWSFYLAILSTLINTSAAIMLAIEMRRARQKRQRFTNLVYNMHHPRFFWDFFVCLFICFLFIENILPLLCKFLKFSFSRKEITTIHHDDDDGGYSIVIFTFFLHEHLIVFHMNERWILNIWHEHTHAQTHR